MRPVRRAAQYVPFAHAGSLYAHMQSSIPRAEWGLRAEELILAALHAPQKNEHALQAVIATGAMTAASWKAIRHNYPSYCITVRVLELLLAGGMTRNKLFFHWAVTDENWRDRARVMIANGYRLTDSMVQCYVPMIRNPQVLFHFQDGIIRCRRAVVALWLLRKRGVNLDKFLARELALAVWTTRCDWEK